jgi:ferritin-like metal-binding protein YciE
MSTNKSLSDLFIDELQDMYDAENRIVKALPKLAKAATNSDLKEAFEDHLEETKGHVKKLEQVFKSIGEKAKAKECKATVGLLKEGDEIASDFKGTSAINAALIAAGQKVEHYEIASYGTLIEWAESLGHDDAVGFLREILDEEKAADEKLTDLARDGANDEALQASESPRNLEKSKRK